MSNKKIIVGIDASRNRSGGAIAHLVGILTFFEPVKHNIESIHVWSYKSLLDKLPNNSWLIKHNPDSLERPLLHQLLWQFNSLSKEAQKNKCDILFTTDASTFCRFKPMVVLSQDMLSYEPGVSRNFGYGITRLRLFAIYILQNLSFRHAFGVIFLNEYAAKMIQYSCGHLKNIKIIPHGVDEIFKEIEYINNWPVLGDRAINCIYVSNAEMYKHQWVVIKAITQLINQGYSLTLNLVGGGSGKAKLLMDNEVKKSDPTGKFIKSYEFLPHSSLPKLMSEADIFIFASSCENMPVTLVEAMAIGMPIACSNRGPMPEVLSDGGVYFNPEDSESIAHAIEKIIQSPSLRETIGKRAKLLSQQYSWKRCADETFSFVVETYLKSKK